MGVQDFYKALDEASLAVLGEKRRTHLGASQIGQRCARQSWYDFRWCGQENFTGRMKRLFNRGHAEEHRVARWLRAMPGVELRDYAERLMYHSGSDSYVTLAWDANDEEPRVMSCWNECDDVSDSAFHIERATGMKQGPKQWGFSCHEGHHSGSCDGHVRGLEQWFPEVAGLGWGLKEDKTHNEKSFKELKRKGVQSSKPVHYIQMQTYMHHMGLRWAVYIAVCKNTDEIIVEIVHYRPEVAIMYYDRAGNIIAAQVPPKKLTNDPSWFECRFCTHIEICQYNKPVLDVNCRSCIFAEPGIGKTWVCNKHRGTIPTDFIPQGCIDWESIA